jgi:hypothetical protein
MGWSIFPADEDSVAKIVRWLPDQGTVLPAEAPTFFEEGVHFDPALQSQGAGESIFYGQP